PFEQTFFDWRGGLASEKRAAASAAADFYRREEFAALRAAFADHQATDARLDCPYFRRSKPCTMLIDEVEALWAPIAERDDWAPLYAKIDEIREMGEAYALAESPRIFT
ncbi:MAG: selenoprotein O, partial [Methylocystis sp.]|nr:selenoprotein O [Methylocystis sp.]